MAKLVCYYRLILLVLWLINYSECGRYGGGGRVSRPSYSSRPSYRPAPSYSPPAYQPSPSYRPSPSHHPSPSYSHPSSPSDAQSRPALPPYRPPSQPAHVSGSTNNGPVERPVGPPAKVNPVQTSNPSVARPIGWDVGHKPSTNQKPIGFEKVATSGTSSGQKPPLGFEKVTGTSTGNTGPVGPPRQVKPVAGAPPDSGNSYIVAPPPYTPHSQSHAAPVHNPAGYGPPPPSYTPHSQSRSPTLNNPAGYGPPPPQYRPYNPQDHPQTNYYPGNYPQQGSHYPQQGGYYGHPSHGNGGTTIINNNINTNHHYGGGHGYYGGGGSYGGGWGGGYPSYHYSSSDVGSGALGFFLGYSLAKVTTPTFHYASSYGGYTPRYDHYSIHHYYHNSENIPKESSIQPNTIIGCFGDIGTICPTGTTSLCTNNGAVLCVASAATTVPCLTDNKINCVKTEIPCVNGTNCEVNQNKSSISIPCVSSAKIYGHLTFVNNTIIVNATNGNSTDLIKASVSNNSTNSSNSSYSSATVTLTPSSVTTTTNETISRRKREAQHIPVQNFCVTILALPAERPPSDGETLSAHSKSIFSKFLIKALGID